MNNIIKSILDDDKYNFHMGNFFFHMHKDSIVKYTYKCRMKGIDFSGIINDLRDQINMMCDLKLTNQEATYLRNNTECSDEYISYLMTTHVFRRNDISFYIDGDKTLHLTYEGECQRVILWEVKLLAIISELYFRNKYANNYNEVLESGSKWIDQQIQWLNNNVDDTFKYMEFGTRRRFSAAHQKVVLQKLWENGKINKNNGIMGTSNLYLGMTLGIPTYGTMAHLLFMFYQTVTHPAKSQIKALYDWLKFYRGKLAIALTDTLGNEKWDRDFSEEFMIRYVGQRHDSGNPVEWGDDRISAYVKAGINPKEKTLMFSDSLTFEKAWTLTKFFIQRINTLHGIGTFLSNTMGFSDHKALSQVIKMTWANGLPTCKLSADFEKSQCEDDIYKNYVLHVVTKH